MLAPDTAVGEKPAPASPDASRDPNSCSGCPGAASGRADHRDASPSRAAITRNSATTPPTTYATFTSTPRCNSAWRATSTGLSGDNVRAVPSAASPAAAPIAMARARPNATSWGVLTPRARRVAPSPTSDELSRARAWVSRRAATTPTRAAKKQRPAICTPRLDWRRRSIRSYGLRQPSRDRRAVEVPAPRGQPPPCRCGAVPRGRGPRQGVHLRMRRTTGAGAEARRSGEGSPPCIATTPTSRNVCAGKPPAGSPAAPFAAAPANACGPPSCSRKVCPSRMPRFCAAMNVMATASSPAERALPGPGRG